MNPEVLQLYREQNERLDQLNIRIDQNSSIIQRFKTFEPSAVFERIEAHQKHVNEQIVSIQDSHQQLEMSVQGVNQQMGQMVHSRDFDLVQKTMAEFIDAKLNKFNQLLAVRQEQSNPDLDKVINERSESSDMSKTINNQQYDELLQASLKQTRQPVRLSVTDKSRLSQLQRLSNLHRQINMTETKPRTPPKQQNSFRLSE